MTTDMIVKQKQLLSTTHFVPGVFCGVAAWLISDSAVLHAQPLRPGRDPKPPVVATEVLRIRPTYVLSTGAGHGYGQLLARAEVLSVSRSASGLKRGSSIIITFYYPGFKYGVSLLSKGQLYRAALVRHPTNTTVKREPLYVPVNGIKSFQLHAR